MLALWHALLFQAIYGATPAGGGQRLLVFLPNPG